MSMLADALLDLDLHALDRVRLLLGRVLVFLGEQRPLALVVLDLLQVAGRRLAGEVLRQAEVPRSSAFARVSELRSAANGTAGCLLLAFWLEAASSPAT